MAKVIHVHLTADRRIEAEGLVFQQHLCGVYCAVG